MFSQGGETSDLTESTILDLFKSDYEKKPTMTSLVNKTDPNQTIAKLHSSVEKSHEDQCVKELTEVGDIVFVLNTYIWCVPKGLCLWINKTASSMFVQQAYKPNRPLATNDPQALAEITGSLDFEEQLSEQVTFIASTRYKKSK